MEHNAPDDYVWLIEVLESFVNEEGKAGILGKFFYSLHEDKSDLQRLVPGEYMYMYNVSEKLLNEFLFEKTKGWKAIALMFKKDGLFQYQVLKRQE